MQNSILIVRRYKGFGGIEHQIIIIASGLVDHGWRVYFLTDKVSPFSEKMEKQGCSNVIAPFGNSIHTAKLIADICKTNKIQIVQSHMFNEDICCRLAKILLPKVKHYYRVHTYIDCSSISGVKKNLYHMIAKLTDFLVDAYLPINEMNRVELIKRTHVKDTKIHVIHDAARKLDLSKGVFCPHNRRMAMIANFERGKGHDTLVEGIRILKNQGEQFHVKLIGGNPGQGTESEDRTVYMETMDRIREFGLEDNFNYIGYSSCIERDIKDCGLVVLPSDSEGTPNCLLEGMLLKKIIVASDVGGIPEFVKEGKTGFLHKPKDGGSFADAVMRVMSTADSELKLVVAEATECVNNEFAAKNVIKNLLKVYADFSVC